MRVGQVILFLSLVLTVLVGWHFYLWLRLVRDPAWPLPYHRLGTIVLVALFASVPLGMFASRALPRSAMASVASVVFVWFGLAFLLFAALLLMDAATWILRGYMALRGEAPPDPERRIWMARVGAGVASFGSALLGVVGTRSALADVQVKEVSIALDKLPPALSGLTVVQLCDLHVGPMLGRSFVESVVEKTNALHPDAIVIVGDLVDGSVEQLGHEVEPLARLRARYGVYFVTGNHEYYSGVEAWLDELRRLGIRVLRNEHVTLGDAAAAIELAGVDDAMATSHGHGHGPDYAKALDGIAPDREVILLAHAPRQIRDAALRGVGLQLSGHTHGGQIWPFAALVRLTEPYIAGLYRHNERTQIYVSCGTGFWGPPMRLRAPAEITKIVLTRRQGAPT